jgi:hypothetical protein
VQAAACPRMRSAGSHVLCKIDANAYEIPNSGAYGGSLTTPPRRGAALGVRGVPIIVATRAHSKQSLHMKGYAANLQIGRARLPHAGRRFDPVGEAAPKQWGHQCASRWAPSSGLTTTSRALVDQRRWIWNEC